MNKLNAINFEHKCVEDHQNNYGEITYHWSIIPEYILFDSGFISDFNKLRVQRILDKKKKKINSIQDYGLDGMSINITDGNPIYNGLQMKLWDCKLCAHHLGTFYQVMFCRLQIKNKLSKGYLYHTCKLEINLSDDIKNSCGMITSTYIKNPYTENAIAVPNEIVLRNYQIEAIGELSKEWTGIKLLNCPCGTGKTDISTHYLKDAGYKNIFIISPLRVHAKQILDRFEGSLQKYKTLLVDSDNDGTRDFTEIEKIIKSKSKCIISSTFKSAEDIIVQLFVKKVESSTSEVETKSDTNSEVEKKPRKVIKKLDTKSDVEIEKKPRKVIKKIIKDIVDDSEVSDSEDSEDNEDIYTSQYDLSNSILIVDEAHNLINNAKLIKLIKSFPKVLLLTATPPSLMEEIIGCDTIYKYSFKDAIQNKYICDYKIYLPLVEENVVSIEHPTELKSLLKLDNDLCKKGLFVINGMLKTGSRKCIVYMSSIEECKNFCTVLKDIMEKYHALPYWTNCITSEVSSKIRDTIISDFQSDTDRPDTLKFLCSVRILDEAIDIVKCDSVFITKVGDNENDIRIVQRICRANRIDKNNLNKVASCFLWCDDINKAIKTLQLLKDNDADFNKKISIINSNYDVEHNVQVIKKIGECNIELAKFVNVKCLSFDEIWEMKKELLFEFCDANERCVQYKEDYKGYKIGQWYHDNKKKIMNTNDEVYINLCENKYVKCNLDKFVKNKELKKEKLSYDEWKELLFQFCNENKRCVEYKEKYKDYDIMKWLQRQEHKIVNGDTKIYENLSENKYIKDHLDEFIKNKEKQMSYDEWKKIIFSFCDEKERCPQAREHHNYYNIGSWWERQKAKIIINGNDEIYKILSENKYIKKYLDEYKNKEKLSYNELKNLLFNFCNENKKHPPSKKEYENYNIGGWYERQKIKIINGNNEIYKILSENKYIKKNLDEFIKNKELNKDTDKEKLSYDNWKTLLFEFCNKNKRCVKSKETYKKHDIGMWLTNQKSRKITNVDDEIYKILSENKYVKNNLDEYIQNKNLK
jgi:superfamily II DNA or RNA helicase